MFFRKFVWLFALILLFGFLFATGRRHNNEYQNGYAQGYLAGQQSVINDDEGTAVTPPQPPAVPTPRRGLGFFGGLLMAGTFLFGFMLFLGLMGLFFGRKRWRRNERHWCGWHKGWRNRPSHWDDDIKDEPIMKA